MDKWSSPRLEVIAADFCLTVGCPRSGRHLAAQPQDLLGKERTLPLPSTSVCPGPRLPGRCCLLQPSPAFPGPQPFQRPLTIGQRMGWVGVTCCPWSQTQHWSWMTLELGHSW